MLKSEKHDEKEGTRNRLTELSVFALAGFGFFETKLARGTYNREKKAFVLRQGNVDKDLLFGRRVESTHYDTLCSRRRIGELGHMVRMII